MKANKHKHLIPLLYIISTLLIPALHTGGLICAHHHSSAPSAVSLYNVPTSSTVNTGCGEHDDSECPICFFSHTFFQIHGKAQQFNILSPPPIATNIEPEDFIAAKHRIFSNPSTAPPLFNI